MAKTKQQKSEEIDELKSFLNSAKSIVFSSYNGLTVAKMQDLRRKLRTVGASLLAVKKTLLKKAWDKMPEGADPAQMSGSIALAFGLEDEVAPAKVLAAFNKENEALKIHGGILENAFIGAEKVLALAKLPSKTELLALTVGTLQAPISGFVNVLAGGIRGLANVLNAIKSGKS